MVFRRYESGDLRTCARLAEDAWPAGPKINSKALEIAGMEGYMRYSVGVSNWTDIASNADNVVGLLFGRIDQLRGSTKPSKPKLGEIPWIIRSFFEYGSMAPGLMRFLWNLILTELKLRVNAPSSDSSIEMFIVDSKERGKGIGTILIDRFLAAARNAGSSRVTVYTDDRMSNWQFYERRGFKKIGEFYDNVTSFYSGAQCQGIIFVMDLTDRGRNR